MALLLLMGQASVLEPAVASTPSSEAVHAMLPCHSESRSHKLPVPHTCCAASLAFTAAPEVRLPVRTRAPAVNVAQLILPLAGTMLPPRTPPPRS